MENDKLVFKKTKDSLWGGDPNDVNPSFGNYLIEQAFSDSINSWVYRNYIQSFKGSKRNIIKHWKIWSRIIFDKTENRAERFNPKWSLWTSTRYNGRYYWRYGYRKGART